MTFLFPGFELKKWVSNRSLDFDVVYLIAKRQLKSRYRKSLLGMLWTALNPLLITLVLWFVFVNVFASRFTLPISYASYVFSGILFVNLVQVTIPLIGDSLSATGVLASKVRVKPQLFVYATAISGLVNFAIGLLPLSLIVILLDSGLTFRVLWILPWMAYMYLILVTLGTFVAILFSNFDDSRNLIAVVLMTLTYVTPIFYPLEILNGATRRIVELNPFTTAVEFFRFSFLNYGTVSYLSIVLSSALIGVFLILARKLLSKEWPRMVTRL